jgi:hypothetical protein
MALSPQGRTEFVNSYTRALITAWSSEEFANKLASNPRQALAEAGLELPANAEIALVRSVPNDTQDGSLDKQIELYERGLATGRFEFHIPEAPQIDLAELSESDLDGVTGGDANAPSINCCCCPCSCCT